MNDTCDIPPSFSFELPVLGPFTAKECLILGTLLLPCLPLFRISLALAVALLSTNGFLALVVVLGGRRGKYPFRLVRAFLAHRFSKLHRRELHSVSSKQQESSLQKFSLETMNYLCATDSERESVLISFISLCSSAEGGLRLISVPMRFSVQDQIDGIPSIPDIFQGEISGIRSFYLSVKGDTIQSEALGSAQLKSIKSEYPSSFSSLLASSIRGGDVY